MLRIALAMLLSLPLVSPAQETTMPGHDDRAALLAAEAAVCQAFQDGDADALRRLLTDDFTLVDSRGVVTGLAQNLAEVAAREPFYDEFRNHGQQVRMLGDSALIVGVTSIRGRAGGDAFAADFRFTDTWVRRNGAWLLAASHASRIPDATPPVEPDSKPAADGPLATVQALFDAMSAHDAGAARKLIAPGAKLIVVRPDGSVHVGADEGFIEALGKDTARWQERMWNAQVQVDGPMAQVWAPYDFHHGGELSHCGTNAVTLAHGAEGWQVVAITYTMRRDACDAPALE